MSSLPEVLNQFPVNSPIVVGISWGYLLATAKELGRWKRIRPGSPPGQRPQMSASLH